jgi:hypothetical protein
MESKHTFYHTFEQDFVLGISDLLGYGRALQICIERGTTTEDASEHIMKSNQRKNTFV